jgi:DNA-binding IclR family transcriptional regulator
VALSAETPERSPGAVEKAFEVLSCFTREEPELGVSQISRRLGLGASTVHRLLTIMVEKGFAVRDPATQRYRLGSALLRLAAAVSESDELRLAARPLLVRLRDLTKETARLHFLKDYTRICIDEVETLYDLRASGGIGKSYRLFEGAASKVILAYQPAPFVESVLAQMSAGAVQKIKGDLAHVRRHGFATSIEENTPGAASVAAAVRNASGSAIAALCVTGPTGRLRARDMTQIAPELVAAAQTLSALMGYGEREPRMMTKAAVLGKGE